MNGNQTSTLRWIFRIALIIILIVLAARELAIHRLPTQVGKCLSFIQNAQKEARNNNSERIVAFDPANNVIYLKAIDADGSEKQLNEEPINLPYVIRETSFKDNVLKFNDKGMPDEGGEIDISCRKEYKEVLETGEVVTRYAYKPYKIEISEMHGDIWLLNEGMNSLNRVGAWIGAICILGIFSYLYKENKFYRVFEHILLGVSLGFGVALVTKQTLYDKWLANVISGFKSLYYVGYSPEAMFNACLIFGGIFGLMWYFQYSKKYLWISRVVIGLTMGAAAGLGIKGTIIGNWPQITDTFRNLFVNAEFAPHLSIRDLFLFRFENILFFVIVCTVLYYFFFSFRRDTSLSKAPATLGRLFLMVSLGVFFGNTFLTRVVILIDRVQFLIREWLRIGA